LNAELQKHTSRDAPVIVVQEKNIRSATEDKTKNHPGSCRDDF
jgi:hypothetical protein